VLLEHDRGTEEQRHVSAKFALTWRCSAPKGTATSSTPTP
jgi:hypothetical protein